MNNCPGIVQYRRMSRRVTIQVASAADVPAGTLVLSKTRRKIVFSPIEDAVEMFFDGAKWRCAPTRVRDTRG